MGSDVRKSSCLTGPNLLGFISTFVHQTHHDPIVQILHVSSTIHPRRKFSEWLTLGQTRIASTTVFGPAYQADSQSSHSVIQRLHWLRSRDRGFNT